MKEGELDMRRKKPLLFGGWLVFGMCLATVTLSSSARPADWAGFRGPNGSGHCPEAGVALTWSDRENLKWKTELPGPGFSSPIAVAGKVFVTCYNGYGLDRENPGRMEDLKRHLLCVDRKTGDIIWTRDLPAEVPEDPYEGFITEHGYASHTPASDGERVYAFFGKSGVAAFDMEGNKRWQTSVGTASGRMRWGSAASPILHENLVIVNASDESQSLVALDKDNGSEVWRTSAPNLASNWSTPILMDGQDGKVLVIAVLEKVWGVDPATGKVIWQAEGFQNRGYSTSLVADDGVVYCAGAMLGGASFALRTRSGAIENDSPFLWTGRSYDSIISPVYYDGHLYGTTNRGIAYCLNAQTGQLAYQARLASGEAVAEEDATSGGRGGRSSAGPRGGSSGRSSSGRGGRSGPGGGEYASPVLADGKIYVVTRSGVTYVLAGKPEFQVLAKNQFAADTSEFCASPAISNGDMFIRSNKYLYCVSEN
jgi:outer membrane protein assembly factor BamB